MTEASSFHKVVKAEDAEVNRRIKEADAQLERWKTFVKDVSIFGTAGAIALAIGVTSSVTMIDANAKQDDKNWAKTTLTSILSGAAGFLFGKHESGKNLANKTEDQE